RARVVQLVGVADSEDRFALLGAQAFQVALLARAPVLAGWVGQLGHDRAYVGAEAAVDVYEPGLAAMVLGGVVQQRGDHLGRAAAVLGDERGHRDQVGQIRSVGAPAALLVVNVAGVGQRGQNRWREHIVGPAERDRLRQLVRRRDALVVPEQLVEAHRAADLVLLVGGERG